MSCKSISCLLLALCSFVAVVSAQEGKFLTTYFYEGLFNSYWYCGPTFTEQSLTIDTSRSVDLGTVHSTGDVGAVVSAVNDLDTNTYYFFEGSPLGGTQYMHIVNSETFSQSTVEINALNGSLYSVQWDSVNKRLLATAALQGGDFLIEIDSQTGSVTPIVKINGHFDIAEDNIAAYDSKTGTFYNMAGPAQNILVAINSSGSIYKKVSMIVIALQFSNGQLWALGSPNSLNQTLAVGLINPQDGSVSQITPIDAFDESQYKIGISAFNPNENRFYTVYGNNFVGVDVVNMQVVVNSPLEGVWALALAGLTWIP